MQIAGLQTILAGRDTGWHSHTITTAPLTVVGWFPAWYGISPWATTEWRAVRYDDPDG